MTADQPPARTPQAAEPYFQLLRWRDPLNKEHESWQPSEEMTDLIGKIMSVQRDIETTTLLRPRLLLLPADRMPERADGGTFLGLQILATDQVATPMLAYPVDQRAPFVMAADGTVTAR